MLNTIKPKLITTISWIIYDFANTIYSMNVVSMYFTTWIVVDLAYGDQYVSYANSLSMILVALTMPILGEISDRFHRKMPLLFIYTTVCVLATAMIGIIGYTEIAIHSKVIWSIVFFIFANYAYQGGLVFYNAMLPHVCTQHSMGRVSGYGVALGYLGSAFGLVMVLPFVEGSLFGITISFLPKGGSVASFIPTAILFLLFSIPTFIFVKDPVYQGEKDEKKYEISRSFKKIIDSLINTKKYPGVARFLIAKFFYEDAIQTIIIFMAVYAQKVMGFSKEGTTLFFLAVIPSAIIGSAIFGILTDHFGPKRTLSAVLLGWILSLIILIATSKVWIFWAIGGLVGVFMGSTWTAARPLLISLVPNQMLGEFFGLYSLSGKISAIIGPLIWAGVVTIFSSHGIVFKYKAAILSLTCLIIIGLVILQKVPDNKIKDSI